MVVDETDSLDPRRSTIEEAPYLVVIETGASSLFPLPANPMVVIGRSEDADLRLADTCCSRRHAHLVIAGGEIRIVDEGSHNGTYVNGSRVNEPRLLTSGDSVTIGDAVLVVHCPERRLPRELLSPSSIIQRVDQELRRAVDYEQPLAILVLAGIEQPTRALTTLDGALRAIDTLGSGLDGEVIAVLPQLGEEEALAASERVLEALQAAGITSRGGLASCPGDGCHARPLLAAARAAAAAALPARVASEASVTFELDGTVVVVADGVMLRGYELIRRLAPSMLNVLVGGETGVGKESAASALHAWSLRATGPLISLNCAALPDSLLEGECFGYERGAFTGALSAKPGLFETADGGTLFLDEVGELTLSAQAKLLRVIETGRVTRLGSTRERVIDVRFVASTHRNLLSEVKAGRFREDLYFRLAGATVVIPPLRDRPREIALLARRFLERAAVAEGKPEHPIAASTMERLLSYPWPGNVRELKHAMGYAAAVCDEHAVRPWHLPESLSPLPPEAGTESVRVDAVPRGFAPLAEEVRALEVRRMTEALAAAAGVQKRAAELIGMPVRTFRAKAKMYGL